MLPTRSAAEGGVAWAALLLPHTRVSPANRASAGDVLNQFPPHGNLFARFVRALVGALWRAVGLWRVDAGTERAKPARVRRALGLALAAATPPGAPLLTRTVLVRS